MAYCRTAIYVRTSCTYFLFGTYVQMMLLPRIQSQSLEKSTLPNTCLFITTNMIGFLNLFFRVSHVLNYNREQVLAGLFPLKIHGLH